MCLDKEKLNDAIVYVSSHSGVRDLGLTKLFKLLYFADSANLREYGESITGSEYIKYEHGPVPSRGENCVRQLRKGARLSVEKVSHAGVEMMSISAVGAPGWSALADEDVATLDAICTQLGRDTAAALSKKSHTEPAWVAAQMLQELSDELMMYGAVEDPDGL